MGKEAILSIHYKQPYLQEIGTNAGKKERRSDAIEYIRPIRDSVQVIPNTPVDIPRLNTQPRLRFVPREERLIFVGGTVDTPMPENVSEQNEEKRKPFAFDLAYEQREIRKLGDTYLPFFIAQAHYYAKETYGRVPSVQYEHDIVWEEGKPKLVFGPDKTKAEESYEIPIADTSLPDWYRKRAIRDKQWVMGIQDGLAEALDKKTGKIKEGVLFFDESNTEFTIPLEERKKWNFGWHSFSRLHQVITIDGKQKLISHTIRNYLDLPEQIELFKKISKKSITEDALLGMVARIDDTIGVGHVQKQIQELYDTTPANRKIVPPPSDQLYISDQKMNTHLAEHDDELIEIFYDMKNGTPEHEILKRFQGWENAASDITGEKKKEWQRAQAKQQEVHFSSERKPLPPIEQRQTLREFYRSQEYKPPANSCGSGSGFGKEKDNSGKGGTSSGRETGPMTYQLTTSKQRDFAFDKEGKCRFCPNTKVGPCDICEECNNKIDAGVLEAA